MRLFNASEMRAADARSEADGISADSLMEAAGRAVASRARARLPHARRAVVLCGPGNNGGDGYVAARHLGAAGLAVRLLELSAEPSSAAAQAARSAFVAAGGVCEALEAGIAANLPATVEVRDMIIDGLFGSGLSRPLSGWLADLVEQLSERPSVIIAIDVPSGVSTDVCELIGPYLRADLTVELAGHKVAGLFYPTRSAYGERVLVDIGMPAGVLEASGGVPILDAATVRPELPPRPADANKYTAGSVCVIAGSERYRGAGELACRGAWRGGAGLVTLVADAHHPSAWPETILEPYDWSAGDEWPPPALTPNRAGACLIGPGLDPSALPLLPQLLSWAPGPVVLDAAALDPEALSAAARQAIRSRPCVLTPHSGEAQRLLGIDGPTVRRDPLGAGARLANTFGAVVVLKGPTTVVSAPDGRQAISSRGHPGMASGGTGDCLAGLVAALLAAPTATKRTPTPLTSTADQALHDAFGRACLAVWLHGIAGELAAAEFGNSLLAGDLADYLPRAFAQLGW